MKYLKLFGTEAKYEAYTASTDFITPNVSLCKDIPITVYYNPYVPQHDYSQDYLTFVAKADGTFKFNRNGVSYSLDDGETWTELASNTDSPTVTSGNKIIWKATLTPRTSYPFGNGTFSSTGQFDVEGNPMSLLYSDNFKVQTSLSGKNEAFYCLFSGNTNVVSAKNLSLPATTLANSCYQGMFQDCTSLTTAPELPATTLANFCYQNMFEGCTSLTTAPELHATTLANSCYMGMFEGCTSLMTAPELPATTLGGFCYEFMFNGCTSLTTAPELPATAMTNYCYFYMFNGCTSLTTAPELPATTLADYCYSSMFNGCTLLNSITCLATDISATNCTNNWVNGVAASGTFTKAASMSNWTSGINGIPSGWNVKNA